MVASEAWTTLEPAWRRALSLAWEAFGNRTIPVGAVLVDGGGEIVAEGRNRVYEQEGPPRQVAASLLAHAEVNALVGLDPERRYEDHVLYTSLEPCLLCLGATYMATVGEIRYAGADPLGGGRAFYDADRAGRRAPLLIDGPLGGAVGAFSTALIYAFFLRRNPTGRVVVCFDAEIPSLRPAAEAVLALDANRPVEEALERVAPLLPG